MEEALKEETLITIKEVEVEVEVDVNVDTSKSIYNKF